MRIQAMTAILFATLILAPRVGAQPPGDPIAGRKIAAQRCSECHAISGPGPSPVAAAPPFGRLHKTAPSEELADVFEGGRLARHADTEMPQFSLTPEEIGDLLAYIRSVP